MGFIGFLKGIFGDKPERIVKAQLLEERYEADSEPTVSGDLGPSDLADFLELYGTHPWVAVCASAVAHAAASVKYQLLSRGVEIESDERSKFLKVPNPHTTWYDLIETTFLHLELAGNCYWEVIRGAPGDGKIDGIYILMPHKMKIVPHAKKKVDHYEYEVGGKIITYKPEEILHLKYTDPLNEYYGIGSVFAAQNAVTLDFWATSWNKNYFKKGAEPGGVLETDNSLSEQAYQRLRATWQKRHQGQGKEHQIAILEEGLKYRPITTSHSDMQFVDLKKLSREEVLAVMRVPPVLIGLTEGVNYATAREQKKIFWQDNLIPKLSKLAEAINAFLMPEDVTFQFVTRSIESIVEDDQVKSSISNANVSHGIMTINEVREKYYGLPPVPWGKVWWAPVGLAPVDSAERPVEPGNAPGQSITDGDKAGLKSPFQVPSVRGPESARPDLGDLEKYELEKIEAREPDWGDAKALRDWREWTFWKNTAGPDDRILRAKIASFFVEQLDRIEPKLGFYKPVKKAEGDDEEDPDFPDEAFEIKLENEKLKAILLPEAERLLKKYGNLLLANIGLKPSMRLDDPRVVAFLEKYGAQKVTKINEFTRDLLRRNLAESAKNGEDHKQMLARIRDIFKGAMSNFRARRIARTEIVTLTNQARHEAARQSGVVKKKRWISELLPTTRREEGGANHAQLHNTVVDMDGHFEASNRAGAFDKMEGPGDVTASPENVVNCLCLCSYFSGTEEFEDVLLGEKTSE